MVDTKKRAPSGSNAKIARPASARRAKLPKEVVASKTVQKDVQGDTPPDCEVLRELGRGSCGVAWLVRRRKDKKLLVMKSVALSSLSPTDEKAVKERTQAMREVQLLKEVKSTHVVQYAGAALLPATSKRSYAELQIFTEYCNGGDLATFLRRSGVGTKLRLPEDRVWKLAAAILAGLNELHRRQILHRDLKPANIFLHKAKENVSVEQAVLSHWPSLTVKVGDLGVARPLSSAESLASTLVGTPYYCAPEVFAGEAYCNKADMYSFGVCVYELMHGKPPHGDIKNIAALIHRVLNLSGDEGTIAAACQLDTAYSADLRGFTQRCMARQPEERPTTSDAMLQIQIGSPTSPASGSQPAKARRAQTPGAGHRGSQLRPRTPRAHSASPRTAASSPKPLSPAPAVQAKPNGTKAAASPRIGAPAFKFQPKPRARSTDGRCKETPQIASPSGGHGQRRASSLDPGATRLDSAALAGSSKEVATQPSVEVEVEVTLRRSSSEGLPLQASLQGSEGESHSEGGPAGVRSAGVEVEETLRRSSSEGLFPLVAAEGLACGGHEQTLVIGDSHSRLDASSSSSSSSLAFSETEVLETSLGGFTGLLAADFTSPLAAPERPTPSTGSGSSWARRILARSPGDSHAASPKQAWATATLLPSEAAAAARDLEVTLKRPQELDPMDLSSLCSSQGQSKAAADEGDAVAEVEQLEDKEAYSVESTTSGMHCKRFLQENRWRSGKGGPTGMKPANDEVVNYVAKAQDYWMRRRQEKRHAAAVPKQEGATVLNLEVRGTAMSPGTRRKPVAAAA